VRLLRIGGRAGVIVPDGVLFGSSNAHRDLRELLVETCELQGVVSMPSGVFKPYAGVSTAVLVFTKGGRTDHVWFYDMTADGYSLDDKRTKIAENDIPDVIARWKARKPARDTDRKAKAFFVPVEEIRGNKYDLSINRYKEVQHEEVQHEPPKVIIKRLRALEEEIRRDLDELEGMLRWAGQPRVGSFFRSGTFSTCSSGRCSARSPRSALARARTLGTGTYSGDWLMLESSNGWTSRTRKGSSSGFFQAICWCVRAVRWGERPSGTASSGSATTRRRCID
jgi:hypothetical protein